MNFGIVFKYFGLLVQVATAIEGILALISAGMSTSTPPINTYIEGMHGSLTLVWTPLGQPVNAVPAAAIADAHTAATTEPVA